MTSSPSSFVIGLLKVTLPYGISPLNLRLPSSCSVKWQVLEPVVTVSPFTSEKIIR